MIILGLIWMVNMLKKFIFSFSLFVLFNATAQALSVDNLFLTKGQHKDGDFFTVTNDVDKPVYIKANIAKVEIKNNEVIEKEYDKGNISDWKLTLNPSVFILDPKESRRTLISLINPKENLSHDEVYSISYIPSTPKGLGLKGHAMALQIGFKVYYIVPAKDSLMDYDIKFNKKSGVLKVKNNGNTYLSVEIDNCDKGSLSVVNESICRASLITLAGRTKEFTLPQELRTDEIKMTVNNYNRKYSADLRVKSSL